MSFDSYRDSLAEEHAAHPEDFHEPREAYDYGSNTRGVVVCSRGWGRGYDIDLLPDGTCPCPFDEPCRERP